MISAQPARAQFVDAMTIMASNWQAVEETDSFLQAPVCRALTKVSDSAAAIELSLIYPKEGKILPMIALRTQLAPSLVAVKVARKETEYFFPLQAGATNADANLYWYAPVNFSRLEELVKDGDSLELVLDPKGAGTAVKVSLKGSGNAVEAARKCLKASKGQVPTDFFKLLNGKKESVTPDLGDRTPAFMFQKVQQAFDAYQLGQILNADLSKLRKANEPLLSKERAALSVLKKANSEFDSAKAKLDTAQNLVASLTKKLDDSKAELAALQAEKPRAEADLAAKRAIYLPLKQQMVPYEQSVAAAAKAVKETAEDIEDKEHTIAKNRRLIPQLESEKSSLQRQLPDLEQRASRLRREYDDADSDYRRYDVRRETQNFLDRDFNYGWAKRDLEAGRRDLSAAQSRLWQAQSALNSCRSTPNSNCSAQESAVNQAQSEVSAAQSKIHSAEWKVNQAESDASRKANAEADRLRRIRDDASSAYDSASRAVANARARIDEIRGLIPRLRAQIERAEQALPGLRDQLAAQQAALAARTQERDDFSRSIGFGVAEANFNAATKHLNEVNGGITTLTKAIPKITKDLASAQKTIPGLTKTFTRAQAEKTAAEAKLAPISEQLKPFREQESAKLAALQEQAERFKLAKATYQELYLELIR